MSKPNAKPCPGLRPPISACGNPISPISANGVTTYPIRCASCEDLVREFLALVDEEKVG